MKKQKSIQRLSLNKKIITNLDTIKGGAANNSQTPSKHCRTLYASSANGHDYCDCGGTTCLEV